MQKVIPVITIDENYQSIFAEEIHTLNQHGGLWLTEQIPALNFRVRESQAGYASDWHVAGDPTLIIVLSGAMLIELRNGESKHFETGDMFIAKDYLPKNMVANESHGHKGSVKDKDFQAVHIKLAKQGA